MGLNCLKAPGPLRGDSLFLTIQFPAFHGTQLINLGRMKDWVDLGATQNVGQRISNYQTKIYHSLKKALDCIAFVGGPNSISGRNYSSFVTLVVLHLDFKRWFFCFQVFRGKRKWGFNCALLSYTLALVL